MTAHRARWALNWVENDDEEDPEDRKVNSSVFFYNTEKEADRALRRKMLKVIDAHGKLPTRFSKFCVDGKLTKKWRKDCQVVKTVFNAVDFGVYVDEPHGWNIYDIDDELRSEPPSSDDEEAVKPEPEPKPKLEVKPRPKRRRKT